MRFIYSTDIHGDKEKYEKLLELATSSGVQNLVIAGDLLPKNAQDRETLQREFIQGWFKDYLRRLQEAQIRFIAFLGNDDVEAIEEDYLAMIAEFDNVFDVNKKKTDIEDCSFIGLSEVLDTPFFRKTRVTIEDGQKMPVQRHDEIEFGKDKIKMTTTEWEEFRMHNIPKMDELLAGLPEVTEGQKGIFVFHCPPYGIGLDVCKDGDVVGSKEMLAYIQEKQPYMSFHGHIHEASRISGKWYANVGQTICMNCGQSEFGQKDLHIALIDTERGLYKRGIIPCNPEIKKSMEELLEEDFNR